MIFRRGRIGSTTVTVIDVAGCSIVGGIAFYVWYTRLVGARGFTCGWGLPRMGHPIVPILVIASVVAVVAAALRSRVYLAPTALVMFWSCTFLITGALEGLLWLAMTSNPYCSF